MTGAPSLSTLKALFAKSSNRCAFPKCTVNIVQGDTILGHVCHIKGSKPGSARYDPMQNDLERHSAQNLIILCPNHHSVVDDDSETYTVTRLLRMKTDHDAHATPLDSETTSNAATLLTSVSSIGQTGGITSGTVNVGTLNLSNAPTSPIATEREARAVEKLWSTVQKLRSTHGDIWLSESILTSDEIDNYFRTSTWPELFYSIQNYESFDWSFQRLIEAEANEADQCRLYVSDRLWGIYATIRAFYGRLGVLYHMSFKESGYKDWRKDAGFATHAKALLGEALYEQAKATPLHGLEIILGRAEAEFLREARATRQSTS